jgi:reactive intermediate/imine deaminase
VADRKKVCSVSPYEDIIAFSRAVRVGDLVFVSGTVAWGPDGKLVGGRDVYAQAKQTLANIEGYLREAGASLKDVVRTRIYLTDMGRWQEVARAHREAFGDVRPASSLLEISRLAEPEMLVEIEAVAVVNTEP